MRSVWLGWARSRRAPPLNFAFTFANLWPTPGSGRRRVAIEPRRGAACGDRGAALRAAVAPRARVALGGVRPPRAHPVRRGDGARAVRPADQPLLRPAARAARRRDVRGSDAGLGACDGERMRSARAHRTVRRRALVLGPGRGRTRHAGAAKRARGYGVRGDRRLSVRARVVHGPGHRELCAPGGPRGPCPRRRRGGLAREPAARVGSRPASRRGRLRDLPGVVRRGDLRPARAPSSARAGPRRARAAAAATGRGVVSASSSRRRSAARRGSRTRACCPAWRCATARRTTC
jgi:hypothetical protein